MTTTPPTGAAEGMTAEIRGGACATPVTTATKKRQKAMWKFIRNDAEETVEPDCSGRTRRHPADSAYKARLLLPLPVRNERGEEHPSVDRLAHLQARQGGGSPVLRTHDAVGRGPPSADNHNTPH